MGNCVYIKLKFFYKNMKLNYLNKFEDSKCKIEISNNILKKMVQLQFQINILK